MTPGVATSSEAGARGPEVAGRPRALVVRTAGTNCDREMVRAFEMAGAAVDLIHVDALVRAPQRVDGYDLIGLPGGFSYGDDIASGRVLGVKAREFLLEAFERAVERRAPIIGVCNGMQALATMGLIPGELEGASAGRGHRQTIAMADNAGARFIDRWVRVAPDAGSRCVWTKDLWDAAAGERERDEVMRLPIAHGEGRFVPASGELLEAMEASGQLALRYVDNVNGSVGAVAGVCDATGLVFGLMPHPERYASWTTHPFWTRLDVPRLNKRPTPGLKVFQNAVKSVRSASEPQAQASG